MVLSGFGVESSIRSDRGKAGIDDMPGHPREGYSRRQFLQRAGLTALAVPSMAAILAACTKPGTTSTPSGASNPYGTGGLPGGPYFVLNPGCPPTAIPVVGQGKHWTDAGTASR